MEWISVKDRLPEVPEMEVFGDTDYPILTMGVLVLGWVESDLHYLPRSTHYAYKIIGFGDGRFWDENKDITDRVAHWMELPKPAINEITK